MWTSNVSQETVRDIHDCHSSETLSLSLSISLSLSLSHTHTHTHTHTHGIMVRMFATGPRDQCSIPAQVIPKTEKMVLDASLLNAQQYKVRIKGNWSNPGKGVTPSTKPRYRSNRKGSLQILLDYSLPT